MSEIGFGGTVLKDGNSLEFKTGSWRNKYPVHNSEKCINCMFYVGYCPDDCIKHKDGKLEGIDYDYCKGCRICAKGCHVKEI